jgi:hypothetical protein
LPRWLPPSGPATSGTDDPGPTPGGIVMKARLVRLSYSLAERAAALAALAAALGAGFKWR